MDDTDTVLTLLRAAGFDPPEDDVAALVEGYPRTRELAALLFAVEEARYESPALHFRADPRAESW
jgi:hypothetical protein